MSLIALIGTADYERRPRVRSGATERSIKHPRCPPRGVKEGEGGKRTSAQRVALGAARTTDLDH